MNKKRAQKANPVNPPSEPRDKLGRFQTGNIGGPGRPRGSRNMLGEAFIADVHADWTKYGGEVLTQVRTSNPGAYLRVVASIIPKDVIVQQTPSEYDDMSDRELVEKVQEEARLLLQAWDEKEG